MNASRDASTIISNKFNTRLNQYFSNIAKSLDALYDNHFNPNDDHEIVESFHEESLIWNIKTIYIELCFALESLSLPSLLSDLKEDFIAHRKSLHTTAFQDISESFSSPAADCLRRYFSVITDTFNSPTVSHSQSHEMQQLENILKATPKILRDHNITPSKEQEIRKCVFDYLTVIFPDTVREIPIPKSVKTYKPDIGVRSLRAAIEYKYADSEAKLNSAIGGILEDMGGYADSKDWVNFFAVIYMTEAFITANQLEAHFQSSNAAPNWKIFLVVGGNAKYIAPRPIKQAASTKKEVFAKLSPSVKSKPVPPTTENSKSAPISDPVVTPSSTLEAPQSDQS